MDFLAPPPRPPNEMNKMNEILDYVFIDSGSPDSYLNADTSILNDSFINATLFNTNSSSHNTTESVDEPVSDLIIMAITSMILGLMILVTVIGNVFVIAAIILERHLQNVANYLVASLAVADLFVACLVMPLGAVYEISKGWILGPELCDIWTSCDVLCCTASILHLVAIALDRATFAFLPFSIPYGINLSMRVPQWVHIRFSLVQCLRYWAVTNVDYMHTRTSTRVFTMIFLVWFISIFVSLAPQFGWKDPEYLERIEQKKCMVSQDLSYQVFATCCTFYVPLLVILVLYWKIYQTARKRIHRRRPKLPTASENSQDAAHKTTIRARKSRLPFSLSAKFTKTKSRSAAVSSLGLVDGNSTNTMNTVEDDSNTGEKKGVEVTTTFNVAVDMPTSSSGQINTVSHQVANKIIVIENDTCNNNHPNGATTTNGNGTGGELASQNQLSIHPPPVADESIRKSSSSNQLPQLPNSQLSTPLQQHKQNSASTSALNSTPNPYAQINKRKETLEAKRERKAAKTLAIITGAFVVCWLPFFLMAIILPLCEACYISDNIAAFFLWLGYLNSLLNPVIYTVFSPEFRAAFKRILFGTHNKSTYRRGKL